MNLWTLEQTLLLFYMKILLLRFFYYNIHNTFSILLDLDFWSFWKIQLKIYWILYIEIYCIVCRNTTTTWKLHERQANGLRNHFSETFLLAISISTAPFWLLKVIIVALFYPFIFFSNRPHIHLLGQGYSSSSEKVSSKTSFKMWPGQNVDEEVWGRVDNLERHSMQGLCLSQNYGNTKAPLL